jgi:ElaA protein
MVPHQRPGPELSARELHDILRLRVAVFVVEQACPYDEVDGLDLEPTTVHWWLADDGGIACYLRTMADPGATLRIGRVVTRADRRSQGLSGRLLTDVLARHGTRDSILAAQSHLRPFYEGHGYAVDGPEVIEDGIPHVPMRRPGRPPPPRP